MAPYPGMEQPPHHPFYQHHPPPPQAHPPYAGHHPVPHDARFREKRVVRSFSSSLVKPFGPGSKVVHYKGNGGGIWDTTFCLSEFNLNTTSLSPSLQHDYDMRVDDFLRRTQAVVTGRRSRPRERDRQRERERPRDARRDRDRDRGRERDRERDRIREREREKERGRYRR
ncbi:unnamed protein product [Coregonus sp. 'balchen']|nr:unnamed protein product [Coregonus sp. 'balchen']